jgi:uncharacterized protein involved in exopolysaccharide biosynthesis
MTLNMNRYKRPRSLDDLKAAVLRRSQLLLLCFVALSAGAVAAVMLATPTYKAQLKLLVKHDRADSVVSADARPDNSRAELSENDVHSQVELVRSDDLLEKVATEAGLVKSLVDSEAVDSEAEAVAVATRQLRHDLRVTPIKRTWLIDVSYQSEDPRTARHVLDTLTRLYLEKHLTLHRPSGIHKFFTDQTEQAKADLQAAEDRLLEFNRKNGVVSAELERAGTVQKFLEFDAMRAQAAAARLEASQRLKAVRAELSKTPQQQVAQVRTSDDADSTRDVSARILELETRRTELLQKFTPQYRGIRDIDAQLKDLRSALAQAKSNPVREETVATNPTRAWLDTERVRGMADNAAASARMQAFMNTANLYREKAQRLEQQNAEERELVRKVQTAEQKYLLYSQKQEEARISDELDRTKVANVVVAQAPTVDMNAKRNPSLAMLPLLIGISLLLSFAAALVADVIDPKVAYASVYTTPAVRALAHSNDDLEALIRARALVASDELRQAAGTSQPADEHNDREHVIPMPSPAPSYTGS